MNLAKLPSNLASVPTRAPPRAAGVCLFPTDSVIKLHGLCQSQEVKKYYLLVAFNVTLLIIVMIEYVFACVSAICICFSKKCTFIVAARVFLGFRSFRQTDFQEHLGAQEHESFWLVLFFIYLFLF